MTDLVERLRGSGAAWVEQGGRSPNLLDEAADEIERLRERCEAYKGQVKAGSDEIERLRNEIAELTTGDCTLVCVNHKKATERLRAQMESGNYLTEHDKLSLAIERQALEIKERDDKIERLRTILRDIERALATFTVESEP